MFFDSVKYVVIHRVTRILTGAIWAVLSGGFYASAAERLDWQSWNPGVFAKAKAEGRFVILDLEAVWCHWCHVMEKTTYQDPKVVDLLASKYVTVRVDQDAHPDLSNRYGDWGWPATIIFAADGSEIVKRRGYIEPENMVSLLEAVIADPSPGPSVVAEEPVVPSGSPLLSAEQRQTLLRRSDDIYDPKFGGWGDVQKYIDPDSMDWMLAGAEKGDPQAIKRVRQTLDAGVLLIDPVAGGIYQYSDAVDWRSPHYEKIMWYQANGLRQYALAYALLKDPKYLSAANDIYKFLTAKLLGPEGSFFTSQDADVDEQTTGKIFYGMDARARTAFGREPRIDRNVYARENGWAISGLIAYYNATGSRGALEIAERAANAIKAGRQIEGGGFRHGQTDRAGPYLGDSLAMGQAALDLYAATGDRAWLTVAADAGTYIEKTFKDDAGGFLTTKTPEGESGAFKKAAKPLDEQIQMARFANRLYRYFGSEAFRALAEHGTRYVASQSIVDVERPMPGILLADIELRSEPTHITIVGHKDDPRAIELHAAARAYPARYKRLDWWDKREGNLPNPDVEYPELDQAAAFACTNRICSLPVFSVDELTDTVHRMLALKAPTGGKFD